MARGERGREKADSSELRSFGMPGESMGRAGLGIFLIFLGGLFGFLVSFL